MKERSSCRWTATDHEVHHVLKKLPHYPCVRFTACTDYAIISMVTVGLGVSILPELLLRNYQNDTVAVPLAPAQYRACWAWVCRRVRTASPVTQNFMRYVKEYVTRLGPQVGGQSEVRREREAEAMFVLFSCCGS